MEQQIGKSKSNNFVKNDDKKQPLSRKPSMKNKKPPEIKQTLTSKYRMLKANPLLKLTLDPKDLDSLPQAVTSLTSSSQRLKDDFSVDTSKQGLSAFRTNSHNNSCVASATKSEVKSHLKQAANSEIKLTSQKSNGTSKHLARSQSMKCSSRTNTFKKPLLQTNLVSSNRKNLVENGNKDKQVAGKKFTSKPNEISNRCMHNANNRKQTGKPDGTAEKKVIKPFRRSLSAQHFDRKKGKSSNPELCIARIENSQSMEELRPDKRVVLFAPDVSPIVEETRNVSFKTPSAYERRSIVHRTPNTSRRSIYDSRVMTPKHALNDLGQRLAEWLAKRGNLSSFHHLKCFDVHYKNVEIDEENKENIEVLQDLRKGSYEDLGIDESEPQCNKTKVKENHPVGNLENVARDALSDLHKLIQEGYPREQCEAWLKLIFQKYSNLEQEPQYWECRAAIEQSRGNISSAVECYKTAIVQGAEIHTVDESLDQLLQKFSLLNISASDAEDQRSSKERARIVRDARNIFKSTIIQFAVQERTLKKSTSSESETQKKFLVTPVRRSTRSRRSAYTSTPGVNMCTSLKELDSSVRDTMDFQGNNALC